MDEGEGEQKRRLWADELQHILAEKDREIERLTQSTEMLRYALQGSQEQYQQLMGKAVRFAESVVAYDPYHDGKVKKEARAFLKEREEA